MSTGKSITTQTNFASKKLLGKAHTSNLKTDVNESIPSNVSIPSKTVFGEDIPNDPGTAFYTLYSASAGDIGESSLERSKRESREALSRRAAEYVANKEAREKSKATDYPRHKRGK